jgi:hypothetical protein
MKKETAIIYGTIVMNYLAAKNAQGYVTLDISQYTVSVHYFDLSKSNEEIVELANHVTLNIAGECRLEYIENERIQHKTFTIYWDIDVTA